MVGSLPVFHNGDHWQIGNLAMSDLHIILENVRTFAGRHEIPLRPLTILTGENSSGKTSFLGMFAALCDGDSFPLQPNFNKPPYNFGNYDTIATYKGGRFGRAKEFMLGYRQMEPSKDVLTCLEATYRSFRGQVQLHTLKAEASNFRLSLAVAETQSPILRGTYTIQLGKEQAEAEFSMPRTLAQTHSFPFVQFMMRASVDPKQQGTNRLVEPPRLLVRAFDYLWKLVPFEALSVAPIRTKPERTYSQITETYRPTGDHIPFLIEQFLRDEETSRQRHILVKALQDFGEKSGLFRDFGVKHLGNKASDPFQLTVKIAGRDINLVDVGYGVSQALPVVVQSFLTPNDQFLLLQQPEVHLHPRAQAALGTIFARIARSGRRGLLIETHSDYIIDRIRQEVAAKNPPGNAVEILYFHRKGLETIPYVIEIDGEGNLTNVPPEYREFFLQEELNLFSRGVHG